MSHVVDLAKSFAQSLDAENYEAARRLLSADCEYTCRGERFHRPNEIVESYRRHGESARREGDVQYESSVKKLTDTVAVIRFVDRLSHRGLEFTFKCQQLVEMDRNGQIAKIEHVDLPGQREALEEYRRRVGAQSQID